MIALDLLPGQNLYQTLLREKSGKSQVSSFLKELIPKRFIDKYLALPKNIHFENKKISDCKDKELKALAEQLHNFQINILANEGYAKAEVTMGGVDSKGLSSKTMESKLVPNLYFIGEVVDVTGWLGGYNFQWAWSSGFSAGHSINR